MNKYPKCQFCESTEDLVEDSNGDATCKVCCAEWEAKALLEQNGD